MMILDSGLLFWPTLYILDYRPGYTPNPRYTIFSGVARVSGAWDKQHLVRHPPHCRCLRYFKW